MIISTSWGVLIAKHQQTKLVGEALSSVGIEHFIPKIEKLRIVHKRHVRELRPLLGDYVLTSINSNWKSMRRLRGVSGIIMNCDGFPAQVLITELKRLDDLCNEGVYHSPVIEDDGSGFEYGQRVTPTTGPFAYHVGRYESKNKRGDLTALFCLFGNDQKVKFRNGDLIAV